MKTVSLTVLTLAMFLGMTGCVAQREADNLRELYRKSQEQVLELQNLLEQKDAQIAALRGASEDPSLADDLAQAIAERDKLRAALDAAEARLREAGTVLPPELSDALEELAAMHPDLMIYDKDRGMVQLRSDLTFALGSASVRPEAANTLGRLAGVLNSAAAQPYEIRLVGHTDNVPVKNPANKQKYGDNWGLSAFRAIAVKDVLQRAGTSPQRMMVAGKGEYAPVVANGPKGAEANRRVEIYIVGSSSSPRATAPARSAAPAPAAAEPAIPDTAETYEEPAMYK